MSMKKLFFLLLLFCTLSSAMADADTLQQKSKQSLIKSGKLVPLPMVYYTPETHVGGGLSVFSLFKTDKKDSLINSSMGRIALHYTMNKQYWAEIMYSIVFPKSNYILTGNASYMKYPNYFFGIGSKTLETDKEQFDYHSTNFYTRLIRKVKGKAYLGLQYQYSSIFDLVVNKGGILANGKIIGSSGGHSSGGGLVFIYDSRNSIINAQRGTYLEVSHLANREEFGSNFNFNLYRLDVRKYLSINHLATKVLALQTLVMFASQKVPFNRMPMLGGEALMRGYFLGRFRDNAMYVWQSEYRQTLSKRFGFAVFGSFGDVAGDLASLDLKNTKYSYGAGLRIALNTKERLNLRIDYGRGSSGGLFYFTVGEAF
jgi:hemolysin activation/secretion protein